MSQLDSQRPFCKACGLHAPCQVCGKVRLSVVPLERTFTASEIRDAFNGLVGYTEICADDVIRVLEEP